MEFIVKEEFCTKDLRDKHFADHVLGLSIKGFNNLTFDNKYEDSEEGREQYEQDADALADKLPIADSPDSNSRIVGYKSRSKFDGNTNYTLRDTNTEEVVCFDKNPSFKTGNRLFTYFPQEEGKFDYMMNYGYGEDHQGQFVKDLPKVEERKRKAEQAKQKAELEKQQAEEKEQAKKDKQNKYLDRQKKFKKSK